ncbi:MAG: tetratricopeptide repeat protein [Acidobacteriota bacterium]
MKLTDRHRVNKALTNSIALLLLYPGLYVAKEGSASVTPVAEDVKVSPLADAYYHFSLGRTLEESGAFIKAVDEYRKAIEKDPNAPDLYLELASAYLRHRRVQAAVQEVENALKLDPNYVDAHELLGNIYLRVLGNEDGSGVPASGEYLKKAIQEFETLARLEPTEAGHYYTLARLYRYDGQTQKAIDALKKHLELIPSSEMGLVSLAQLYSDKGELKEAIQYYKKALEVNPVSARILTELAFVYEQSKDYKSAVESYKKAMEYDEDSLDLRKGLAQVLLDDGQDQEAEREYLKILEADPDEGHAYLRLGQIYKNRNEFDKALEYFNRAGAILVTSQEVSFHIGVLYKDLGKYEKAEERFQQLLKMTYKPSKNYSPPEMQNRGLFLTYAGYIAQQLEKYPKAVEYFTELKDLSSDFKTRADSYIIDTYRSSKQIDKALAACEAVLKEATKEQKRDFQILYAELVAENGKPEQAIKMLEQLLTGSEEDLRVYGSLLQVYQREKRFKDAERTLKAAEKYYKKPEEYLFTLGALYERQKEYDRAEGTFKKVLELDDKHHAALNYLGYMFADRGVRLAESLELIQKAVNLDPNNGAYLDSLGWVYFQMNRLQEAEVYLKKAQDRVRKDPTIHEHLGDLYYKKGVYDEARKAWELSISYSSDEDEIRKIQKKVDDLKMKLASAQKK